MKVGLFFWELIKVAMFRDLLQNKTQNKNSIPSNNICRLFQVNKRIKLQANTNPASPMTILTAE